MLEERIFPADVSAGAKQDLPYSIGASLTKNAHILTDLPYCEDSALLIDSDSFFEKVSFNGGTYKASGGSAVVLENRSGEICGDMDKTTVLIFPDGFEIRASSAIAFRNLIIVGDVKLFSGTGIRFENVHFKGKISVCSGAFETVFDFCRFSSLDNAGEDTCSVNSYISFDGIGIQSYGRGLYVQNCLFEGKGRAIVSRGSELEIRSCTIDTDKDGIGIDIENSENALIALSIIRGAEKSVVMADDFNSVVLCNSLFSLYTSNGKNIYVCDNILSGRLCAKNNNYLIADGNVYPDDNLDHSARVKNNKNVNGDTVTDVNRRADVGADEELIPHVNKDQFISMRRKQSVKEFGAKNAKSAYGYISSMAESNRCVILAPGVYTTDSRLDLSSKHSNTTIYAYGVYIEAISDEAYYTDNHIRISGTENISVKGITLGYKQQSCGQVYVLEKTSNTSLKVISGAGMDKSYFCKKRIGIQRAGTFYALGDFYITSIEDNSDGTLTVRAPEELCDFIRVGDILTCSLLTGSHSAPTSANKNLSFTDVVLYGSSGGMAFTEIGNETGNTYLRVCITTRSGEIIDEDVFNKYADLQRRYDVDLEISVDELEKGNRRFRGSPARLSSKDATHVKRGVQGSQLISCLFENMCDDGTNQNSNHARLSEIIYNDDGTATVIYKGNMAEHFYVTGSSPSFSSYCAPFRVGDRLYIYTSSGRLVCDTPVLSASVPYSPSESTHPDFRGQKIDRYATVVRADAIRREALSDFDLTDDTHLGTHKVLVDNMSLSSNNFSFDNSLFRNVRANGMRIKASGGVVKNCTFRNFASTAIAIIYELRWGESGISENLRIEKNIIDHTSYTNEAPPIDNLGADYCKCPITIMGLGGGMLDPDCLLYKNILIEGNKFINRCLDNYNYAIYASCVCGLTVKSNDFGSSPEENGKDKVCLPLYLSGSMDIELSGNIYSPTIRGRTREYVHGESYCNVFGSDVEDKI